jgi:phospholipid transport system substrate-binding protein
MTPVEEVLMKRFIPVALFLLLVVTGARAEVLPDALMRSAADKIARLTETGPEADARDPQRLYALVDLCEEVLPHIDFRAMARSALGRHWREATPEQRARFAREFRNLLLRVYGTAMPKSADQQIVFLPFLGKPGDETAVVKTELRRPGRPSIAIHYSFYNTRSFWKLYDITVDGVSLVTTYRITYAEAIQKDGIDAVIANLARSNYEFPGSKRSAVKHEQ